MTQGRRPFATLLRGYMPTLHYCPQCQIQGPQPPTPLSDDSHSALFKPYMSGTSTPSLPFCFSTSQARPTSNIAAVVWTVLHKALGRGHMLAPLLPVHHAVALNVLKPLLGQRRILQPGAGRILTPWQLANVLKNGSLLNCSRWMCHQLGLQAKLRWPGISCCSSAYAACAP